jgi:hypothetical protein
MRSPAPSENKKQIPDHNQPSPENSQQMDMVLSWGEGE